MGCKFFYCNVYWGCDPFELVKYALKGSCLLENVYFLRIYFWDVADMNSRNSPLGLKVLCKEIQMLYGHKISGMIRFERAILISQPSCLHDFRGP